MTFLFDRYLAGLPDAVDGLDVDDRRALGLRSNLTVCVDCRYARIIADVAQGLGVVCGELLILLDFGQRALDLEGLSLCECDLSLVEFQTFRVCEFSSLISGKEVSVFALRNVFV